MSPDDLRAWAETKIWPSDREDFLYWFDGLSPYTRQALGDQPWYIFHVWNLWTGRLDE